MGDGPSKTSGAALSQATFDEGTKEFALKVLLDYSAATGRKWTHIRKEIYRCVGADIIKDGKFLTRQDLEHWASGHHVIGNPKFSWIYQFLTDESTLQRPHFITALSLLEPSAKYDRIGYALGEFYTDFERISFLGIGSRERSTVQAAIPDVLEGVWENQDPREDTYLQLTYSPGLKIINAELWTFPRGLPTTTYDWDVDRERGFMTVGSRCIIHLKSLDRQSTRVLFAYPTPKGRSIVIVPDEIANRAQMMARIPLEERHRNRGGYFSPLREEDGSSIDGFTINPEQFARRYLRSKFNRLQDIIDNSARRS